MSYLASRTSRFDALLLALVVAGFAGACGGSDGGGSANVAIDAVEPDPTYADLETSIDFTIEPGDGVSESDLEWEVRLGDGTTKSGEGTSETSVPHTWEAAGSYSLEVIAKSGGSSVGSASRDVDVLAPVDLGIADVSARPNNVDTGDDLTVQFDIDNNSATAVQTPFDVFIYLAPDDGSAVSADTLPQDDPIGSGTIGGDGEEVVGAGGTRSGAVTVTVPDDVEPGAYRVVAWARPAGQVSDENPDNNYAVGAEPDGVVQIETEGGLLPDVDVRDVFVVPDRAFPALNEFQRGFTITNNGKTDAVGVTTETYLSVGDPEIDEDDLLAGESDDSVDIPGGSSKEFGPDQFVLSDDITPPEDGEKEVYVIVRASLEDEESNAENNVAVSEPPITVSDERADGPDIVVNSFSVSPETTYLGGSLQVDADISNEGNADVTSFLCRLYLGEESRVDINNDDAFDSVNIQQVETGASVSIERTAVINETDATPGTYNVYMYCDPNGALEETFRGNNARIHPEQIEVTAEPDVDMKVARLDVPQSVQDETDTTVTAEVCVTGTNASGGTRGALYQSVGQQVDFSAEPKETFPIPNITPGNCRNVDITFEASCADFEDTYAFGVKVDSKNDLEENNEMNNTSTGGNTMTIDGEYCSCPTDQYEQNDKRFSSASVPSAGRKSATVCDPGECDFFDIRVGADESLRVETTFRADKGDLETTLFDPSGVTVLDEDTTPGRQRVATFNVPSTDDYVFSVCGATATSRNLYDMDVDILSQPSGVDLIPRKVEMPNKSTYTLGETVSTNLRIHNIGDQSSNSFEVEFVITPDRTVGNGNDVPLSPSTISVGGINAASQTDSSTDLELPNSLSKGTYYIAAKADPAGNVGETDTSNNTSFSKEFDVETRCYDALEPNDSFSRATSVQDGSYNNLTACASEDDYYELCPADGKKFDVDTTYTPQDGDVDLILYDQNQQRIDSSATTGQGSETVSVSYVNGAQCYYIYPYLVTQQSQVRTTYDTSVTVDDVDPSLRCDSHFEPNDNFTEATSLITAIQQSQSGTIDRCPSNDDEFYRLELSQNQTVTLSGTIDPASQPGSLRLQLYKPNQTPTVNKETAPGDSTVKIEDYTAPTDGTYFLQVTLTGSDRNITYEVGGQGLGGIDLKAHNLVYVPSSATYSGGDTVDLEFDISNVRSDRAKQPSYEIYLGYSSTHDPQNDTLLTSGTLGRDVSGNATATIYDPVTLPSNVSSGTGYLHVKVESDSSQTDPNASNDVGTTSISLQ